MTPPRTLEEAMALFVAAGGADWLNDALLGLAAVAFLGALVLGIVGAARR